MRGVFGVMAAAAAAVVVAAWRRVHRDGVELRLAERTARERARARRAPGLADEKAAVGAGERDIVAPRVEPPPVERSGGESAATIRIVRRSAEPADSIRIVRRSPEPAEPIRSVRRGAGPSEPAGPEAERAEPARAESSRTEPREPVRAEPPFPAEAPERGRAEPPVPPAAWRGGTKPGPARVPRPMYWPAFLALGVVWAAWGSISTPLLIFGGIAVFAAAIALWICEMIHAD